ncbi:bifunctional adenosylcobinamide kinase/adenosylcobinamide-phosphate guanylyltransferase [filamentous cyanobacterium LEGE 11480]|uniref:Adenosylcobinamide kinase n=1 Tax=Romeriopsis navalis LEGE 11480 TaxID=2777977 RepID=A0A928Z1R5_9CYAN|nr:bifunctional adenosylcobinamide kinase/adenosylcobinamide-phosphate guanylyltransferase [Romeriopsis navalis]MBE9028774.1 bifunctional adenosylcobinamide kinase/adenosylcobinamide-phosphate guanylyltransferase [Romeriopsis navalis LEGE 11480]
MLILVTGGARSGKSHYAQNLALELSDQPVYVATARNWGGDFGDRIQRHKDERGAAWTNFETEKAVSQLPLSDRVVVIDCITLWLTNFFLDGGEDVDGALQELQTEIDTIEQIPGTFIIVTNELGMGVHADTDMGRKFTDLQGWANQYVAAKATQVVLMISGIPVRIKG